MLWLRSALGHGAAALAAALVLFAVGQPLFTDDAWWHLALGRAFAEQRAVARGGPAAVRATGPAIALRLAVRPGPAPDPRARGLRGAARAARGRGGGRVRPGVVARAPCERLGARGERRHGDLHRTLDLSPGAAPPRPDHDRLLARPLPVAARLRAATDRRAGSRPPPRCSRCGPTSTRRFPSACCCSAPVRWAWASPRSPAAQRWSARARAVCARRGSPGSRRRCATRSAFVPTRPGGRPDRARRR